MTTVELTNATESHVLASYVEYMDGTCSVQLLGRGSFEECRRTCELLPAIISTRPARDAHLIIVSADVWERENREEWLQTTDIELSE